jgi:hypothetical protein
MLAQMKKSRICKENGRRFGFANHTAIQKTSTKSLHLAFSSIRFLRDHPRLDEKRWRESGFFSQVIHNASTVSKNGTAEVEKNLSWALFLLASER